MKKSQQSAAINVLSQVEAEVWVSNFVFTDTTEHVATSVATSAPAPMYSEAPAAFYSRKHRLNNTDKPFMRTDLSGQQMPFSSLQKQPRGGAALSALVSCDICEIHVPDAGSTSAFSHRLYTFGPGSVP